MATATKRERGIAKGGLTRAENSLYGLIGRKRPLSEVEAAYEKVKGAYDELVTAHIAYLRQLTEDVMEAEDAWLESFTDKFDKMGMDVNDYAATFEPVLQPAAATAQGGDILKLKVKVESVEKPTFGGKVLDYFQFRKDFRFVFGEKYNAVEALYCLRKAVSEDVRRWLVGINEYREAWNVLDQQYGDPRVISDAVLTSLTKIKSIPEEDGAKFANLYHQVKGAKNILGELHRANDLDNSTTLATIESKLSYSDRLKWARFQLEKTVDPNIDNLLQFMSVEMSIKRIAGAEIRSGTTSGQKMGKVCAETGKIRGGNDTSPITWTIKDPTYTAAPGASSPISTVPKQPRPPSCWVCGKDDHPHHPQRCTKFVAMGLPQRLAEVRKNKACYFCLGKHYGPCRQRTKCTQMTKQDPCKYSHHVLLHGAPFDSPTSMAGIEGALTNPAPAEDKSILPVVQGEIINLNNGLAKSNGCIFLDSGASLSLIKEGTAKQLELPGKNVTVTIGKIGATEEDYRTKLYTLHVRTKGGGQNYRIQAVGIPEICGEIVSVQTEKFAELFKMDPSKLNRGSGHPDLLIGLDYVKFHVGETTVSGDVALRQSPLGPVIFGVTEGGTTKQKSGVYLLREVRHTPELDLKEFWSAEEMGIAVNPCCMKSRPELKRMSPVEKAEDEMIRKSAIKIENRWMIPIPWKKDPYELPDNYSQAYARLRSTEKKLSRNTEHAQMYNEQIEDLVSRGCA